MSPTMPRAYPVCFEVAGPAAIFTRPDSGAAFVSYPAPTYSALKGVFECVARWESAYIRPVAVDSRTSRSASTFGRGFTAAASPLHPMEREQDGPVGATSAMGNF